MAIVSFRAAAFLTITALAYFLMPKRFRYLVLLAASLYFYAASGARCLLYISGSAVLSFAAALWIEHVEKFTVSALGSAASSEEKKRFRKKAQRAKRAICTLTAAAIFSVWIVLKYGNFVSLNLIRLFDTLGLPWQIPELSFYVPLGMSFYTFISAGYLIDIYRGKYKAERNLFKYLLFVSFFGHIVQGPFSRYDKLSPTLFTGNPFSYRRAESGLGRILYGVMKKTIIADPIGLAVRSVIGSGGAGYPGRALLVTALLYGMQIYADFSGYMDIVCGACGILGIELEENFRRPYFACSVEEFWRRWHITLGAWFRDYMFYPISMSPFAAKLGRRVRGSFGPKAGKLAAGYFALIFVWTATGLWHGAAWRFVIWGWLNLFVIAGSMLLEGSYGKLKSAFRIGDGNPVWRLFAIIRTYILVSVFRIFSISPGTATAISIFGRIFTSFEGALPEGGFMALFPGLEHRHLIGAAVACLVVFIVDILEENGKMERLRTSCPSIFKSLAFTVIIFAIILFAGQGEDLRGSFIYANF